MPYGFDSDQQSALAQVIANSFFGISTGYNPTDVADQMIDPGDEQLAFDILVAGYRRVG